MPKVLWSLWLMLALLSCAQASHRKKPQGGGQAGNFDYYVLSLSWSPEHCATTHDTSAQCNGSRPYGFVVHGLWPQLERGYPHDCDGPQLRDDAIPKDLLDIMPSRQLIGHEWPKHGTCTGLPQDQYFQKIEDAFALVKIPAEYRPPIQHVQAAPADIKGKFVANNPGFSESSFAVVCSGRYLQEVRVCLTKDLKGRTCGADVRDTCQEPEIILRPLR